MLHHIYKDDGLLAAEVQIFAAWLDLEKRKLISPPAIFKGAFNRLDRTEDFEEILLKAKI